jgi:hypothetical protein
MARDISAVLAHVKEEPVREILKYKYRNFRFRGLAALFAKVQPRYRRRLKWQIFDAAIESGSQDSIAELIQIFAESEEPLNLLLAPTIEYLKGDSSCSIELLNKIADNEAVGLEVRRASFFLTLVINSHHMRRVHPTLGKGEAETPGPHFQFWDAATPPDVAALLKRFEDQSRSGYEFFDDRRARDFMSNRFGREEAAAYDACHHPAAKSDFSGFAHCTSVADHTATLMRGLGRASVASGKD